jgi:type IV pilus assembly protein PilB
MAESLTTSPRPAPLPTGGDPVDHEIEARRLASRYELEFVDLEHFHIDHALFRSIPADLMLRYGFVPYRRDGHTLLIVVSDPRDLQTIDEVGVQLGTPIRVCVGTASAIQAILKKSESSQRVLEEATEGFQMQILRDEDGSEEHLTVDKLTSDASPVIRLVDSMVFTALQRRASDIHIETQDDAVSVKYRIDGVLQPAMKAIDKRHHSTIISRIKVMAELDIAEKRVPQDGRFKLRVRGKTIDFRVSIMPSVHGEDAVIRILDKESMSEQFTELRLDILGFPDDELRRFRKYIREPYGMVLVTGPTGSGKTTTLYAALSEIKSVEDKIITIEDPVEYQLKGITQIPINEKKGLTFARGLRSILRHDPDKIMVGEIRDPETAQIAIQSALTGHLVFTTVHANNVIDVLGRFLNMGVEAYQFISALNCVLAQRLVRQICRHCRREAEVTPEMLAESAIPREIALRHRFYEGAGCIECGGTGFKGRTAICELMDLTDRIRDMILDRRPTSEIKRAAREEGMTFLRECAVRRVFDGVTTLREINKVTFVE